MSEAGKTAPICLMPTTLSAQGESGFLLKHFCTPRERALGISDAVARASRKIPSNVHKYISASQQSCMDAEGLLNILTVSSNMCMYV